jgi:hypothetical protein
MAVIQDPTCATFCVWQDNKNTGIQVEGEVNALCWSELWTGDKPMAIEFYTKLFGWERVGKHSARVAAIFHGGQLRCDRNQNQPTRRGYPNAADGHLERRAFCGSR